MDGFLHLLLAEFTTCCGLFNLYWVRKPTYTWNCGSVLDLIQLDERPNDCSALVPHELP